MRRALLWILLLTLGAGLLLLVSKQEGTSLTQIDAEDFASALIQICIAFFILGGLVSVFRGRVGEAVEALLFWFVVAFLLAVGYTYRVELRDVADRVMVQLVPGSAVSRGHVVELSRARAGDFRVNVTVNGKTLPMILDTGASSVVLTHESARQAGLPMEVLNYSVTVDTANGRTRAASVTLDRVAIGNIAERAVPALIAQPGALRTNLLGMSFLNRLESWEVRGDRLILRGHP